MLALRDSPGTPNEHLALEKFWLTLAGIYIWEFISTLSYEWNVIRGRHPYRWTIWLYSTARLGTLMTVIFNMISFFGTSRINCQASATSTWFSAVLGLGPGSLLIVLRIFAIWNGNKVMVAISAGLWGFTVSLLFLGVVRVNSRLQFFTLVLSTSRFAPYGSLWQQMYNHNVETSKLSLVSLFVTDCTLLLIMLVGLLRLRSHGGGTLELGRLLWNRVSFGSLLPPSQNSRKHCS
ncbi:hypothetical protein BJV77DRAFT_643107 [Russula vinacea]|nr:hypothetical protein BJV77DRAFT_643107 [Russula vinacea]